MKRKFLLLVVALLLSVASLSVGFAQAPIKVGTLVPLTGPLAEFGPNFINGAGLAAAQLKVVGLEIELIHADTETSAIPGVAAARKLVDIDKVVAIAGAAATGVTLPVAESVTIPNKVVQISYASTSPLLTVLPADEGQNFLYRTCPSDALQGVIMGKLAWELGYKTASALYVNNPYGQGLAEQFKKSFEHRGGKVLAMVPHDEAAAPTYVAELRKATEGSPDILAAISYPGHATIYLREAIEGGFASEFLFCDGTKSLEIIAAVGTEALEGMQGTAPGSALTKSYESFLAGYAKTYGTPPPLPYISNMYDAVAVIGLAIKAAQVAGEPVTGTSIRDHLRDVANPPGEIIEPGVAGFKKAFELLEQGKDINYEGAAGSVDFDENGNVVTPIEIWKFSGGTIAPIRVEVELPEI